MSESILTNNSAQSAYEQIDIIIQQQSRCYLGTSRYWNRHPYHTYGKQTRNSSSYTNKLLIGDGVHIVHDAWDVSEEDEEEADPEPVPAPKQWHQREGDLGT